jgi:erythromycin esterase-like protein
MQHPQSSALALAEILERIDAAVAARLTASWVTMGRRRDELQRGEGEERLATLRAAQAAIDRGSSDARNGVHEQQFELARLHLQVLEQAAQTEGSDLREEAMAANVQSIAGLTSGPVVLWAHNVHVQRGIPWEVPAMGEHLHRHFGSEFRCIGFGFSNGEFCAFDRDNQLKTFSLDVPDDSLAAVLAGVGDRTFLLRLDQIPGTSVLSDWLATEPVAFAVGQSGDPLFVQQHCRLALDPRTQYDALVWVPIASPAHNRLLPSSTRDQIR